MQFARVPVISDADCKQYYRDPSQLWKRNDSTRKLTNKGNIWQSTHKWDFEKYGTEKMIYIINASSNMVLESRTDGTVVETTKLDGKSRQLWNKGEANAKGYFTLKNGIKNTERILTANFAGELELKGK